MEAKVGRDGDAVSETRSKGRLMARSASERYQSLDVLRGFAVFGILLVNIQSFSMIGAAYLNPTAYGDLTGVNLWVWAVTHVFGDQKFMTIFSVLFGAGIVLFSERLESKGRGSAWVHYRRTFWLLVAGLIHAYVLWYGDILVTYALCALVIYWFRNRSPKTLVVIGIIFLSIASLIWISFGLSVSHWTSEALAETNHSWRPDSEVYLKEIQALRGDLFEQMAYRIPAAMFFQTFLFVFWAGWRVAGLMLIGMAFFKWGILTAEKQPAFYKRLIVFGFTSGLPLVMFGIYQNFSAGWTLDFSMFLGSQYNYWGSLFISSAFMGAVLLWTKTAFAETLKRSLAAVGRMAFTNYLLQTVICTFIFYGHGFGLFGRVDRWAQLLIVVAIWILTLIVSPLWLKHFRFGPMEWLWRTLTYFKLQPLRKSPKPASIS